MSLLSSIPPTQSSSALSSQLLVIRLLFFSTSTLFIHPSNCKEQVPICPRDNTSTGSAHSINKHRPHCGHCHLSVDHYKKSCPQVEEIVFSVTSQLFKEAPVSAPATIKLFFHDCFVDGCDASIMLLTEPGSKELAERDAPINKDLAPQGFDSVNKAKVLVESQCPGVVSCADILAMATRDFVHLAGGPHYEVQKGRWDSRISKSSRIKSYIPFPNTTITNLINLFKSKSLTITDLVVLSGAHTIGFAHCKHFINRIYNYNGTTQPDPNIDPNLLKELRMYCPPYGGNKGIVVPFDVTTPFEFDNAYYGNLQKNRGVLVTDQGLFQDPRTRVIVESMMKDKDMFFKEFGNSMGKMGSIRVKLGPKHGEIRRDCSLRN